MKYLETLDGITVPVFYPRWLFAAGFSPLCCVLIKAKYRNDVGLHEHELTHIEQAAHEGWLDYALGYLFNSKYRMRAEVEAYRRQIACYGPGKSIEFAVKALTNNYWLGITEDEARAALA
jgi:hypothetical protein